MKKHVVNTADDIELAPGKTIRDWKALRVKLTTGNDPDDWEEAFDKYFRGRLKARYFDPIKVLEKSPKLQGEGFSIVTIQCSLIEFLESTYQGKSFTTKRPKQGQVLPGDKYCDSGGIFTDFLTLRPPFEQHFKNKLVAPNKTLARDFYECVRCGLMHEARTKDTWVIRVDKGGNGPPVQIKQTEKIIYRNNFQEGLREFIKWYKGELTKPARQQAFISKFDSLCQ